MLVTFSSDLAHSRWLAGSCQDGSPDITFGINLVPAADHKVERNMDKGIMPTANQHICLAGHPGVNRIPS
jgi:hypothetical protein